MLKTILLFTKEYIFLPIVPTNEKNKPNGIFFKQNIIIIIIILQTTETYVPHLFSNNLDNVYKFKFEKKKKKNFLLLTIFFFSNIFSDIYISTLYPSKWIIQRNQKNCISKVRTLFCFYKNLRLSLQICKKNKTKTKKQISFPK